MSVTFGGQLKAALGWDWKDTAGPLDKGIVEYDKALTNGTGENQAEMIWWRKSEVLLDGQSQTFDLTSLTRELLGSTITQTFYKVKGLLIIVENTTLGNLIVGDAAANEWSGPFWGDGATIVIPPDSHLSICNRQNGWGVDASNKNLKLFAHQGDVTSSIAIVGTETDDGTGSDYGIY